MKEQGEKAEKFVNKKLEINIDPQKGWETENLFVPPGFHIYSKIEGEGEKPKGETGEQPFIYPMGVGGLIMNGCFATNYQKGDPCYESQVEDHNLPDAPECRDYNVLSQPNRHQSFGRGTNSDSNLVPGWYRFQSSSYSRMVDNCIQVHRCTTDITGWLKGGHPTFKDGIVDREACFHGWQNCCYRIVQIRVRECQGFYVYELNPSPEGRYRYCARG
ncbi:hypothetical protein ABFA07_002800 [Porites harrisoni]